MRLDVIFDPTQRPEAQQVELRKIPHSERVDHPELKAAIERYEKARIEEKKRRDDFVEAEGPELERAREADAQALAAAIQAGKADPGPRNERKAETNLAEARRQHAAAKLLLGQAVDGIVAAFDEYGDAWQRDLEAERDGLRSAMEELLAGWERSWRQLQQNSANRAIGRSSGVESPSLYAASITAPRVADGGVIPVSEILERLRKLAEPQKPRLDVVENQSPGDEPTRHWMNRDERIRAWQERDEAEARARAESLAAYGGSERLDRAAVKRERLQRAAERRADREAQREAERKAIEATR
jgi:hypothetical protein